MLISEYTVKQKMKQEDFVCPTSLFLLDDADSTLILLAGDRSQSQPVSSRSCDTIAVLPAETREHETQQVCVYNARRRTNAFLMSRHSSITHSPLHVSKGRAGRAGSISSVGSEPSPALSVLSLDALVAPETPIQFDIISPVSEENSGQSKTAAQSGR